MPPIEMFPGKTPGRSASTRLTVLLALSLRSLHPTRGTAEDRVEYRFEDYNEDDHRMHIQTHAAGFETEFLSKITAKGLFVYDSISGATPTGEPAPTGSNDLPLAEIEDVRKSISLEAAIRYDRHTTTPQYSFSEEGDYRSHGIALNHTIDFNQKNTTLVLGAAHNFDSVGGGSLTEWQRKDTTDVLVGLNQILGPRTVLTVNLTLGYADGYLADPYRRVTFLLPDSPDPIFTDPAQVNPVSEKRPDHHFKQVGYASVMQAFPSLGASLEGSYRLHHDDWDTWSHTVSLTWAQKIGSRIILAPTFRYYYQTAAYFYAPSFEGVSFAQYAGGTRVAFEQGTFLAFEGDPGFPAPADESKYQITSSPARPDYYSADYRLSELQAFTYGIGASVKVCEHFSVEMAYKRYEMQGLDGVTSSQAYPSANVFTIGFGVPF